MTIDELKRFAIQIGEDVVVQIDKQGTCATLVFDLHKIYNDVQSALKETDPAKAELVLGKALFSQTIEVVGFSYTNEKLILQCRDADYIETAVGLIFDTADETICIKEVLFPCFGVIKGLNGNSIEQAFIDVFNACDHKIKTVDIHSLIEDTNTKSFVDAWKTIYVHKDKLDIERYRKMYSE